jgi:hypothetical protein
MTLGLQIVQSFLLLEGVFGLRPKSAEFVDIGAILLEGPRLSEWPAVEDELEEGMLNLRGSLMAFSRTLGFLRRSRIHLKREERGYCRRWEREVDRSSIEEREFLLEEREFLLQTQDFELSGLNQSTIEEFRDLMGESEDLMRRVMDPLTAHCAFTAVISLFVFLTT